MSAKLLLLFVVVVAIAAWFIIWGPEGFTFMKDAQYGLMADDLKAWVGQDINAAWFNNDPAVGEVQVSKVKIIKSGDADQKDVYVVDILVKGSYISRSMG